MTITVRSGKAAPGFAADRASGLTYMKRVMGGLRCGQSTTYQEWNILSGSERDNTQNRDGKLLVRRIPKRHIRQSGMRTTWPRIMYRLQVRGCCKPNSEGLSPSFNRTHRQTVIKITKSDRARHTC